MTLDAGPHHVWDGLTIAVTAVTGIAGLVLDRMTQPATVEVVVYELRKRRRFHDVHHRIAWSFLRTRAIAWRTLNSFKDVGATEDVHSREDKQDDDKTDDSNSQQDVHLFNPRII